MNAGIALYCAEQMEMVGQFHNFSRVEISGEMLEEAENARLFDRFSGDVLVRELLPRRIMDDLPDAPVGVSRELLKLFEQRCRFLARYGMDFPTLTPNVGRALEDSVYRERMLDLLRCMFGIAWRSGVNFAYELRLPENFPGAVDEVLKLCRSCNIYVPVLIDFHPHEPKGFELLAQAMEKLSFKREAWRISFEVASCNYLSADVVKKIYSLARKGSCREEYVIFAPGAGVDAENYRQLDLLAGECAKGHNGVAAERDLL